MLRQLCFSFSAQVILLRFPGNLFEYSGSFLCPTLYANLVGQSVIGQQTQAVLHFGVSNGIGYLDAKDKIF